MPDPVTGPPVTGPSPFNAIAPVVLLIALPMVAVEIWLSSAEAGLIAGTSGVGLRMQMVQDWGFSPVVWDQVMALGDRSFAMTRRFVTYGVVHGSFTHALFAVAMLLALGKFVGDIFAAWAIAVVFLTGLLTGAAVFGLILDGPRPLYGAYPGVYALIGAFTWIIFARLGAKGENRLRAFRMIGFLLVLQVVFAALSPLIGGGFDPAFIAEIAAFGAGFLISVVVSPGGFVALRARLRAR